ncbi:MAG: DUF3823 domain-containing protein [Bacteroidales bacterium]|jgi:hypothetical protein|nr:DUF3823 domain-containing protein [Bacteroidales bacterium]
MKQLSIFGIAVLTVAVLVCTPSCNKDDDNGGSAVVEIKATVENGVGLNVDKVKALLGLDEERIGYDWVWTGYEVASTDYTNGGFTLKLPETVPASRLGLLFDGLSEGVTVNPATAKGMFIVIVAYNDENEMGEFEYIDAKGWTASYTYVDRDVTVTGSYTGKSPSGSYTENTEKITFDNLSLKKGWNVIYHFYEENESTKTNTSKLTNTKPAGLKWIFNDNYDEADGIITGTVIDVTTGEGLVTEQPNGFLIYCREDSWTASEEKPGQDFWGKADGTFRNTRIFAGSYSVYPKDGPFHPADTIPVEIRSGKETKVNFEVTPYCSFSEVVIEKSTTNSQAVVVSFKVNTHALPGEPATIRNYRIFASNRTQFVGNNVYDESVSSPSDVALTESDLGTTITVTATGFQAGKTYYIRIGARCKESPQSRYNMTRVVSLSF